MTKMHVERAVTTYHVLVQDEHDTIHNGKHGTSIRNDVEG
jgi:hypothetical protein